MADERVAQDDEPAEGTFLFREQADGRKVARLPGGKVILLHRDDVDRVRAGEWWNVRLTHRDTYTIARAVERASSELVSQIGSTPLSTSMATAFAKVPRPAPSGVGEPAPTNAPTTGIDLKPATLRPLEPPVPAALPVPARVEALHAAPGPKRDPRPPIPPSRVVGMNDRVAMFVDGANMDLACRLAGFFVDYGKARRFFLAHGLFYAAFYYIADYTASDPLQQRYLDFLAHVDFIVRRKAVKAIRDQETGERLLKANVDTELVLDLINTADNYDLAFLFSGDSDFERAVDLLRSRGKRVYLVTSRPVLSRELAYVADKPIFFLEEFREELERERKPAEDSSNPR
jgi:uncharacterized LabA/DUF88 family protein